MIFDEEYNLIRNYLKKRLKLHFRVSIIKSSFWRKVFLVETVNKKYILKIACRINNKSSVLNEVNALRMLKSRMINNVPEVLHYNHRNNYDFMLVEYVCNTESFNVKELSRILGKIHSIYSSYATFSYQLFISGLLRDIYIILESCSLNKRYGNLSKEVLSLLSKISKCISADCDFLKKKERASFINGDLYDDIYSYRGRIYLIDWHISGFGDRAWDIARFLYTCDKHKNEFLSGYTKFFNEDKTFNNRLALYSHINKILILSGAINTLVYNLDFIQDGSKESDKVFDLMEKKILRCIYELRADYDCQY